MEGLKVRLNNRPYTRGIHKGERIDTRDYAWPEEFNLWTGLQYQAAGIGFFPPGIMSELEDERDPTDRKVGPRNVPIGNRQAGPRPAYAVNPDRTPVLRGQAPPYASGIRGNPGMAVPYPGR